MFTTIFKNFSADSFWQKRLIYDNEAAPPSPENFSNPEKQKAPGEAAREIASQSPSDIVSNAMSAGGATKSKYATKTQNLANLIDENPLNNSSK